MRIKVLGFLNSERQKLVQKNLDNISFEMFEPLKPSDKLFDTNKSKIRYPQKPMNDAEISCSLSHYQMISNGNTDLILEDDAIILDSEKFKQVKLLREYIEKSNYPSIIILGHSKVAEKDLFVQKLKQPLVNRTKIQYFEIGENYRINYFGTVGYMFNSSFSKKLASLKCDWRADDWNAITEMTKCKIYHLRNLLVLEDLKSIDNSQIENKLHSRHDFRKKPLTNLLKVIRIQIIYLFNKNYFIN